MQCWEVRHRECVTHAQHSAPVLGPPQGGPPGLMAQGHGGFCPLVLKTDV